MTIIDAAGLTELVAAYKRVRPTYQLLAESVAEILDRRLGPSLDEPIEVACRSISVGLLGEIAMLLGRKICWNPECEEIIGDPEASALLGRSYREPWTL